MNLSPLPPPPFSSSPQREQQQQAAALNNDGIAHALQGGRPQAQGTSSAPGPHQAFKSNGHHVQQHAQTQYQHHVHVLGAKAGGPSTSSSIPSSVNEGLHNYDNEQNQTRPLARLAPRPTQDTSPVPSPSPSSLQQQHAQESRHTPSHSPYSNQQQALVGTSSPLHFRYDNPIGRGSNGNLFVPLSSSSSQHVPHNHPLPALSQSHVPQVQGLPQPQSETPRFPFTLTLSEQLAQTWRVTDQQRQQFQYQQHQQQQGRIREGDRSGTSYSSEVNEPVCSHTQSMPPPPPPGHEIPHRRPSNVTGTAPSDPLSMLSIAVPGPQPQRQQQAQGQPCTQCAHHSQKQQPQQFQQSQYSFAQASQQQQQRQQAFNQALPPQQQHMLAQALQQMQEQQHTLPVQPQTTQSHHYNAPAAPNQQIQAPAPAHAHASSVPLQQGPIPASASASAYLPAPMPGPPPVASASGQIPPAPLPHLPTPVDPLFIAIAAAVKPLRTGLQSVLIDSSNHFGQTMMKMYDDCIKLASLERQKVKDVEKLLAAERCAWERERRDMQAEMGRMKAREERLRSGMSANAHQVVVREGAMKNHAVHDDLRVLKRENEGLRLKLAKLGKFVETIYCKDDSAFVREAAAAGKQGQKEGEKSTVAPEPTPNLAQPYSHVNDDTNTNPSDTDLPPPTSSSSSTLYDTTILSRSLSSTPTPAFEHPHPHPSQLASHPQPHIHRHHSAPAPIPASECMPTAVQPRPLPSSRRSYANSIMASPESRSASPAFVRRQIEDASVGGEPLEELPEREDRAGGDMDVSNPVAARGVSTSVASQVEVIDLCSSPMSMVIDLPTNEEDEEDEATAKHYGREGELRDIVENMTRSRTPSPADVPRGDAETENQTLIPPEDDEVSMGDVNDMEMEIEDENQEDSEMDLKVKLESEAEVKIERDDVQIEAGFTQHSDMSTNDDNDSITYHFNTARHSRTLTRTRSPAVPPLLSLPTPAAGSALSPSLSRSPSPAPLPTFVTQRRDLLGAANPTLPPTPTLTPTVSPFSSRKRPRAEFDHDDHHRDEQGPATRVKIEHTEGEDLRRLDETATRDDFITFSSMAAGAASKVSQSTLSTFNTSSTTATISGASSSSSSNERPGLGSRSNSMDSRVTHSPVRDLNNRPNSFNTQTPSSQHSDIPNASLPTSRLASSSLPTFSESTSTPAQPPVSTTLNTFPSTPQETPAPTPTTMSIRKPRTKEEGEITPTPTPTPTPTSIPAYVRPSPSKEEGEVTPTPTPTLAPAAPLSAPAVMTTKPRVAPAPSPVRVPVAFAGGRRHTMPAIVGLNDNMDGEDGAWDVRPASTSVLVSAASTSKLVTESKHKSDAVAAGTTGDVVSAASEMPKQASGSGSVTGSMTASTPGPMSVSTDAESVRQEAGERVVARLSNHQGMVMQSQARAEVLPRTHAPSSSNATATNAHVAVNTTANTNVYDEVDAKAAAVAIGVALADAIRHPDSEPNPILNTVLNTLPLRPLLPAYSTSQGVHSNVNPPRRPSMDSTPTATIAVPMKPPSPPAPSTQSRPHSQASSRPPSPPQPLTRPSPPNPSSTPPATSAPLASSSNSNSRPVQRPPPSSKFNTLFRSHPHPQPLRQGGNPRQNTNPLPKPQTQPQPGRSQVQNSNPLTRVDVGALNSAPVGGPHRERQPQQQHMETPHHMNRQQQQQHQRHQQQYKLGINHMDLLYNGIDGCWTCRTCLSRRQQELTSSSPSDDSTKSKAIAKFSKEASWTELVGHCYKEHPDECRELERLTPAQIAEKKERMHLRQHNFGQRGNGIR